MTSLTIFPADIAEMSVSQLASLPPAQKQEISRNLDEALDWLKKARTKFDAALEQCYGEQARTALRESGRDFGAAHISDGPLHLKFELPKKISWDQKRLAEIAERIVASGEKVGGYIDIKLSISESRYTNWPPALQQQFAAARTVDSGKPSFTLSLDSE
ncbi:hypothetical protein [Thiomonas sp.]|uniref:hypothetical protein n=1 Tax=Thiomonas sp. TaxID=2047785 RepID=UPI0025838D77|nr:hypothetical protein [Thiomonas sp.]